VLGPSRVVDPTRFRWTDDGWRPPALADLVVYELHVGTFSAEGTFDGVVPHLAALADLGVTAIELMPVAEFPGTRGWGYDGVHLGAAQSTYGGPEGLARLVDAAHAAGLAVLLDVVHNHIGATGSEGVRAFGPYFTDTYATWWGDALNLDGADSGAVREWILQSVDWWVGDLHLDGLRLDAVHAIVDQSAQHIVAEVAERAHRARPGALVIAESGLNDAKVIRPPEHGGWGCDAQWADDLHHAVRVLLTGERDGYYADFGTVADLAKAYRRPFVHDGQYSPTRRRRFGAPADDRPPEQFVVFTMDHDQVGNRALGDRLPPEVQRVAALLVLLSPFTPMLFMGEEYGERAPFQFFTDHIDPEIATATREGRRREFAGFAAFSGLDVPDPQDPATFERSRLTRVVDECTLSLYRALLRARRDLPPGDVDDVRHDEGAGWLAVRRGRFHIVANLSDREVTVPVTADTAVVATHPTTRLGAEGVTLPPFAGALVTGEAR
jgi:maltooligosyltrehalose trehalohydrolase